jgi:hypothetical protein
LKEKCKFDQTFTHNFVSFDFFGNLYGPDGVSRRDASIKYHCDSKNVDGLAMREEKPKHLTEACTA